MHSELSFSSKNLTPSWLASSGTCWMMASRTRQFLSSASCTMAGRVVWGMAEVVEIDFFPPLARRRMRD